MPNSDTDTVPVSRQADLALAKSHTDAATAGTNLTWTLTVTNRGPSVSRADATHPITVVDTLPAGTTFLSGGSAEWTCGAVGQVVTCHRTTDMAVGAGSASAFPVVVAVAASQLDELVNTATVSPGSTPEPDTEQAVADNTATDTVTVTTSAALTVAKSHATGTGATAGSTVEWTVTVGNDGPSESWADADHPIVLTDTLPAGTSFVSATGDYQCAAAAGQEVRCERTTPLAVGISTVTLTVLVAPDTLGDPAVPVDPQAPDARSLTNAVAIIAVTTPDPTGSDEATDTAPLGFSADLALTKTHEPGTVPVPGDPFTWTLQVTSLGPSVSRGTSTEPLRVSDTLPTGVVPTSAAGEGWTCTVSGQDVGCVWGTADAPSDLPLGDAPAITLTAEVDESWTQAFSNTAYVHPGTTDDPHLDNNTASDPNLTPEPASVLTVTKSHDPATVRIGDPLAFAVQVSNTGPSTATGVVVHDTLPAGLVPVGGTGEDFTCGVSGQDVTCTYDDPAGMLPLGDGGVVHWVTVTATVTAQAYPAVENHVLVTAATQPPDSEPVQAVDPVVVPPQVDLAITKTLNGALIVGETAQYALTVTNTGPTEDPGPITVTDALPDGLVATDVSGGTCTIGAQVTCELPAPLAVGASAQILLTVQVGPAAYPKVSNTATVATTSEDTDLTNNTSSLVSPVTPLVGMTVFRKAMPGPGEDQVTWTITVGNTGPNPNPGPLTLTDELPAGLRIVSVTPADGWECTTQVACTFGGDFGAGRSDTITVVTTVTAGGGTTVTNTATLVWAEHSTSASAGSTTPVVPELPNTGSPVTFSPWTGLSLLLGGLVLIAVSRRRRSEID